MANPCSFTASRSTSSWKYVRQGRFNWRKQDQSVETTGPTGNALFGGDGNVPARFEDVLCAHGIRLRAIPAVKDQDSFRLASGFPEVGDIVTLIHHEGKYKLWHLVWPQAGDVPPPKVTFYPNHNQCLAYAESEDGVTWHAPELDLYTANGKSGSAVVHRGDASEPNRGWSSGSVFHDPSDPARPFKMIFHGYATEEEWKAFEAAYPGEADPMGYNTWGIFGGSSPDGIHWTIQDKPLMLQHADTWNTCTYDQERQQYIAYVRTWQVDPLDRDLAWDNERHHWLKIGRRCIGRSVSRDFTHFSKPELVVSTDPSMPPSHVWYTNNKTTLPGCPDQHVMLPWLWELENDGGDCHLLSSPDGWTWGRVPGGPVVARGAFGDRDGAYLQCRGNLVELPDGSWAVPYKGFPIPHKYPGRDVTLRHGLLPGVEEVSGFARWRPGRLVALECPEVGCFATVAVMPPGRRIELNAVIPPSGYIKVAACRMDGNPAEGRGFEDMDPFYGDETRFRVSWNGETDFHLGSDEPLVLRFEMKQAELYAIHFAD